MFLFFLLALHPLEVDNAKVYCFGDRTDEVWLQAKEQVCPGGHVKLALLSTRLKKTAVRDGELMLLGCLLSKKGIVIDSRE